MEIDLWIGSDVRNILGFKLIKTSSIAQWLTACLGMERFVHIHTHKNYEMLIAFSVFVQFFAIHVPSVGAVGFTLFQAKI